MQTRNTPPDRDPSLSILSMDSANDFTTINLTSDEQEQPDTEIIDETDPVPTVDSVWRIFLNIMKIALPMSLTFTVSIETWYLSSGLAATTTDVNQLAGIILIMSLIGMIAILPMTPLFGMDIALCKQVGELRKMEDDSHPDEVLATIRKRISEINKSAMIYTTIASALIIPALYHTGDILINWMGQDEKPSLFAQEALRYYSIAVPGLFMRLGLSQILNSFEQYYPTMLMGASTLGAGITVGLLLAFGVIGSKAYEAKGLMAGLIIEAYATPLLYSAYILLSQSFKDFHFFDFLHNTKYILYQFGAILKIGLPFMLTAAMDMIADLVLGIVSGKLGIDDQSSMSVVMQMIAINAIINASFATSCAQEISRLVGGRQYDNANRVGRYGFMISAAFFSPVPIICASYPKILLITTHDTQQLLPTLTYLAPIMAAGVFADGLRFNWLQQLRAVGDNYKPTLIAIGGTVAGLGVGSALAFTTSMGVYGLATGYSAGIGAASLVLGIRWGSFLKPATVKILHETPPVKFKDCLMTLFKPCLRKPRVEVVNDSIDKEQVNHSPDQDNQVSDKSYQNVITL